MSGARQDPRWQEAQAAYVDDYEHLGLEEAFIRRVRAATRMYEIEREYETP